MGGGMLIIHDQVGVPLPLYVNERRRPRMMVCGFAEFDFGAGDQFRKDFECSNSSGRAVSM
jgi:hypothetical protein